MLILASEPPFSKGFAGRLSLVDGEPPAVADGGGSDDRTWQSKSHREAMMADPRPKMIEVYALAEHAQDASLDGATTVVIDVLRATTAKDLGHSTVVTGGERGGLAIDGFDLGNSPSEYVASKVAGKTVLLTTTNGTRALRIAAAARRTITACAGNLSAVVQAVADDDDVRIVCAGTNGAITREDVLVAGAIVHALLYEYPAGGSWKPDDVALLAADAWHALLTSAAAGSRSVSEQFAAALARCHGGRNLLRIGHADDLAWCARIDRWTAAPVLDTARQSIHLP